MARFPLQIVSPQTRISFQSFARFFIWLFATFKAKWRGFVLRFAPLWLPLLLIWVLPTSREVVKSNYQGGMAYTSSTYTQSLPDALSIALAEPNNLGAQLRAIGRTRDYQYRGYSYQWSRSYRMLNMYASSPDDDANDSLTIPETNAWLNRIQSRFPLPWLRPFLASARNWNENEAFYTFPPNARRADQLEWLRLHRVLSPQTRQVRAELEAQARREPQNAFWILKLAQWEWAYAPRSFYSTTPSNFAFTPHQQPAPATLLGGAPWSAPTPNVPSSPGPAVAIEPAIGPHPLPSLVPNDEQVLKNVFAILLRARSCTYFEDGYWQGMSEIRRELNKRQSLPLDMELSFLNAARENMGDQTARELLSALWGGHPTYAYTYPALVIPYAPIVPPLSLAERTAPREIMAWGAALAHITRLRDRHEHFADNQRSTTTSQLIDASWSLDTMPPASGFRPFTSPRRTKAVAFANRARRLGLPDLARETLAIERELASRDALLSKADAHRYMVFTGSRGFLEHRSADALLPRFALSSVSVCQGIATALVALCPIWMFLSVFLGRGVGTPSSQKARWTPTFALNLLVGIPFLLVVNQVSDITFTWYQLISLSPFVWALFLGVMLALWCTTTTVIYQKKALVSPENDRWHTHFISRDFRPWAEPLLLGASFLILAIGLASLCYFAFDPAVGNIPLPSPFRGYVRTDVATALTMYGLASSTGSFTIWLLNWRWPSKSVRTVTHTGLRWWKESIGASICTLAWLYLFVALAAWPARLQAKHMIEERWQMGDWAWLQKNL